MQLNLFLDETRVVDPEFDTPIHRMTSDGGSLFGQRASQRVLQHVAQHPPQKASSLGIRMSWH